MNKLNNVFTPAVINHYKQNKDLITEELLKELRSHGNEGKQIALDILDMEKDSEQYYLDAYGNRISHDGNRRLKKSFTKIPFFKIHEIELMKCAEDIHYFKNNYVKITTQKGINFPDLREYQNDFLDVIKQDENESIVSLQPRQCCSSTTMLKIQKDNEEFVQTFEELFNECKRESK